MILNNNNLDIFVCSHKQYKSPVLNKVYKAKSGLDLNGSIGILEKAKTVADSGELLTKL